MIAVDVLRGLVAERVRNLPEDQLVALFQERFGLTVDGDLGPVTQREIMRPRFCGVKDFAAAVRPRWDHTRWNGNEWVGTPANMLLKYHIVNGLPGFTLPQTYEVATQALGSLSRHCAIDFIPIDTPTGANLLYKVGKIDGPSSTLAWCQLPVGQDTPATQLNCLIDNEEPWVNSAAPSRGRMDAVRVWAHETGHGVGLDHGPDGCLLAPYYDVDVREPQDWDIKELKIRYAPRVIESPPPVPPSNPNAKAVVTIRLPNGVVYNGELEPTR